MQLDLTALDDAVLERLRGEVAALRTVATLDSEEDLIEGRTDPLPAAYTLVNGAVYAAPEGNSGHQDGGVALTVFVKARNLRGNGAARKDLEGGAYALVGQVGTALLGWAPTVCAPLSIESISAFDVTKTRAIYAVKFTAYTSEEY